MLDCALAHGVGWLHHGEMRLGELLIQAGAISEPQLDQALREQKQFGGRLGRNLVELGFLTESTLTKVLAEQLHLPRVSEAVLEKLPRSVLDLLSIELVERHSVCPVRLDGPRLHLAMSDPLDKAAIAAVSEHSGCEVRPLVAPEGFLRHALQRHYGISPKSKFIKIGSSAALAVVRYDDSVAPANLPVFDPFAPQASAPAVVEVGSYVAPAASSKDRRAAAPPLPRPSPASPSAAPDLREALTAARTIDDVGDVIVAQVRRDFTRAVLLLVRGGDLVGWRLDAEAAASIQDFRVPLAALRSLDHVLAQGSPVIMLSPEFLAPLIGLLGTPPAGHNLLLPIAHKGRPAALVCAVGGRPDAEHRAPEYARFAAKVSLAFQLVVLKKQLLE